MHKVKLTTTFRHLDEACACPDGYRKLAKHLGGVDKYGRDTPINLLEILESNGPEDMVWCLRATEQDCNKVARLMAADFAEAVLHLWTKQYPDDDRPAKAIQAARDYANGLINSDDLNSAYSAAYLADLAARSAYSAADSAADSAAYLAADSAAYSAAYSPYLAAYSAYSAAYLAAKQKQTAIIKRHLRR